MRHLILHAGSVLVLAVLTTSSQAQCCYLAPPRAPDMCGPGWYWSNYCGYVYGPNYNVTPPFQPFQGMILGPCGPKGPMGQFASAAYMQQQQANPAFAWHPWARSPRDYFMMESDPLSSPYNYGMASTGLGYGAYGSGYSYGFGLTGAADRAAAGYGMERGAPPAGGPGGGAPAMGMGRQP